MTDELTGVFNRRQFNTLCDTLLARRSRPQSLALCMFDLDHFKRYNDRYGHQAGDRALRAATAAVQACLRRSDDALFRLGGEEFAVLYTAPIESAAEAMADEFRKAIVRLALPHADHPAGILTASFGLVCLPPDADPAIGAEALYALADRALYAAKSQGRNCVVGTGAPVAEPAVPSLGPG